jgi:CubicO group peptidase (beta-lactamase class C family)
MASMTKPIVANCAMTLVEDCTLRLDDPVDFSFLSWPTCGRSPIPAGG